MAIFEEKQPAVHWIVLLIATVFLVSFPLVQIGMNELYSTEGEYAAAALEFTGANTLVTVHGTLPDAVFLLYPAIIVKRIGNEEKVLAKELSGYDAYLKKVKYRLFPKIW